MYEFSIRMTNSKGLPPLGFREILFGVCRKRSKHMFIEQWCRYDVMTIARHLPRAFRCPDIHDGVCHELCGTHTVHSVKYESPRCQFLAQWHAPQNRTSKLGWQRFKLYIVLGRVELRVVGAPRRSKMKESDSGSG